MTARSDGPKKGARVTSQPSHWYDGTPVKGWPDPAYVGTVEKVALSHGVLLARVRWDSGRKEWRACGDFIVLENARGGA